MTLLNLKHKGKSIGVRFPTTVDEVNRAVSELKRPYDSPGPVRITYADSPISNLAQYIKCADPENEADIQKLNHLAAKIDGMSQQEQYTFSGALDAESVNGLDDILRIADSVDQYELIGEVSTDRELGNWLVEHGRLDVDVPETVRPYLDYVAIGAEYYADHGGAYTIHGYVKRREPSQEQTVEQRDALITLHLLTQRVAETMSEPYRILLPATDEELDRAKAEIDVDDFSEATIVKIEFGEPYLDELIPQSCLCVEDANELALCMEKMQWQDGELLKYLAVLSVMQPETLTGALTLAMDLDDYEKVTSDPNEYGKQVLRRIGADEEVIDTIDGYMDFKWFGEDSMVEDGVRQTEFGLIRRCSRPFPEEAQGQQMGGIM